VPEYVAQIDGYDPGAAAAVSLYLSSVNDERVCHLNAGSAGPWMPAIAKLPEIQYDLIDASFSGRIATAAASMEMAPEPWPNFGRYILADARYRLWSGNVGDAWGSWTLRFDGRVQAQPQGSNGRATLQVAVDDSWLDQPLLATYAGTGGLEGGANLKGTVKPLALGAPRFVPPIVLDATNNVFQLSAYGLIQDVEEAFERVASFGTSSGDYATLAALIAATIPAGSWATCKAQGLVRHGAPPTGRLSYHVKGDMAGPDGWVRLPGSTIRRIALLAGGTGKTHDASLYALNTARPWNISKHFRDQVTAREAITRIAASVNAIAGINATGQLFAVPIPDLSGSASTTLDTGGTSLPQVASLNQLAIDPPWWRMAIQAVVTEDVHPLSDVAFAAPLVERGAFDPTAVYMDGNIVQYLGASWLYTNTTPTAGNAPPTPPTTSNAWWTVLAAAGSNGANGLSAAQVLIYQRAASAPALPSATVTYAFATGSVTGLNNGWTQGIPAANGNPLYVSAASAASGSATDTIAPAEWAAAVILNQDGAAGANGINTATIFLFQRSTVNVAPAVPSVTTTYTFATGTLASINNGWAQSVPPESNGAYLWVTTATALGTGSTDTIATSEWAAVRLTTDASTIQSVLNAADDGVITKLEKFSDVVPFDRGIRSRFALQIFRANALGLFGASRNDVPRSQEIDNASWNKARSGTGVTPTVTANAGVAPDGTTTADRVQLDSGAGTTTNDASYVSIGTTGNATVGQPLAGGIWLQSNTGQVQKVNVGIGGSVGGFVGKAFVVGVDPTWCEIPNYFPATAAAATLYVQSCQNAAYGTDRIIDVLAWGAQIDLASRYCRPYVPTSSAAVTQSSNSATVDAAFTAWLNYKAALDYIGPAWDDVSTDSTIFPADNLLANALDFTNASWTQAGSVTITRLAGASSTWWTLGDATGAAQSRVSQVVSAATGQNVTVLLDVLKDAVGKATRYMAIDGLATIYLDTSTGEVKSSTLTAPFVSATAYDCGDHWTVVIEFIVGATNPGIYINPAYGSGAVLGGGNSSASTGQITVRRPRIILGLFGDVARASFRNRVNALVAALDALDKAISEQDAKRAYQVKPDTANATVSCDSTGSPVTGELPKTLPVRLYQNGVEITTGLTWSYKVLDGVVNGFTPTSSAQTIANSAAAQFVLSSIGSSSATVEFTASDGIVTVSGNMSIAKSIASPPVSGGSGGGTGGTADSQTGAFTSVSSGTAAVVSKEFQVTIGSGAQATFAATIGVTPDGNVTHTTGTWNVRFQWEKWNGSAYVSQGTTFDGSGYVTQQTYFDNATPPNTATVYQGEEGTAASSSQTVAATAGSTVKMRLKAFILNTSKDQTNTVYLSGQASLQG
jgi:hypothetical protein